MARPLRLEFPGALYHLTARGNAQQPIYLDDADRQRFLRLVAQEIHQQHWRCYAYCLMDNHYHLVVETPEPTLSRGLRRLHGTYTQYFNRRHRRVGHLLQGRFKSLLVEKENYLQELCRYVVLNPVRARLVKTAQDWPWSSYGRTVGLQPAPAWLDVPAVLQLFDVEGERARLSYQRFVEEGVGLASPWTDITGQIFLGSPAFRERMEELLSAKPLANVPVEQTCPTRPSAEQVLQRVAALYQVPLNSLVKDTRSEAAKTAVYLLRRAVNEPLQTVAVRFGVSPSRVSQIQRAIEERPLTDQQRQVLTECKLKN